MKRSTAARLFLLAVAASALVGCTGPCRDQLTGAWDQYGYNGQQSGYRSMTSGDSVGLAMVEDKIYFAKKNQENSVYATVTTEEGR